MKKSLNHTYLIVLLAILSSIAPVAIDAYIPSIPSMAKDFNVGIEKIEFTLPIFLIGFAIGQIFGGVLSDRIGRKRSSIIGLLGFAFASFVIVFSTHIYELWIFRLFEAFFGGLIVVNGTAIVRDMFHGSEAAKVFSLIGTVRSLAPLLAPAIGALIIYFFEWEAVFVFLTIYALVAAFFINKDLKETYTYTKTNIIESYKIVLSNFNAIKIMLVLGLCFSGMFTFVTKASFIYIEYFGLTTNEFPLYFGISVFTLILLLRVNIKLLRRFKTVTLVKMAVIIQLTSSFIFIILSKDINLYTTVLLTSAFIGANAFVYGNCTALALENFPKNAGVASSVIGVVQFGVGALVSSLVVLAGATSLTPIAIGVFTISVTGFLILRSYKNPVSFK